MTEGSSPNILQVVKDGLENDRNEDFNIAQRVVDALVDYCSIGPAKSEEKIMPLETLIAELVASIAELDAKCTANREALFQCVKIIEQEIPAIKHLPTFPTS